MQLKKYILAVVLCLSIHSAFAQLNPWWMDTNPVDSNEIKRQELSDTLINYAKTFIGVPYLWGGSTPEPGFDCSGFICYVYKQFGITLPRTSSEQFNAGLPVPYNEAKPGDLILFAGSTNEGGDPGHVGIVISYDATNGYSFIHTSSPESGGVRISNELQERYYYKRFLEIRRVINFD